MSSPSNATEYSSTVLDEETIEVLYNTSYGGFRVSEKVMELYNNRKKEIDSSYKPILYIEQFYNPNMMRHDPILVNIFYEIGNKEFNDMYSNIKIAKIPKKYENHYTITEYDGLENIEIDINKYKVDMIKQIIKNDGIYSDEKIEKIITIL